MSISIGVGILTRSAWGFVVFGILVLVDSFLLKSAPAPEQPAAEDDSAA
jgi:hypothetical protein